MPAQNSAVAVPPESSAAATSVTWPLVASTTVPTGSCCASSRSTYRLLPGSLTLTVPLLGSALTVLPGSGGGSCAALCARTGGGSSFAVTVHVRLSPGFSVIEPSPAQSPRDRRAVAGDRVGGDGVRARQERVVVPELPACGLPETSSPPRLTCTMKLPGPAVPPWSLTTWVMTRSLGAMSFAVIVQSAFWPSGASTAQAPDSESA